VVGGTGIEPVTLGL